MRQEVDDHNESLKYDDELADVKKSLDDANAENQRLSDENEALNE